jgi:hypothetical protein
MPHLHCFLRRHQQLLREAEGGLGHAIQDVGIARGQTDALVRRVARLDGV